MALRHQQATGKSHTQSRLFVIDSLKRKTMPNPFERMPESESPENEAEEEIFGKALASRWAAQLNGEGLPKSASSETSSGGTGKLHLPPKDGLRNQPTARYAASSEDNQTRRSEEETAQESADILVLAEKMFEKQTELFDRQKEMLIRRRHGVSDQRKMNEVARKRLAEEG